MAARRKQRRPVRRRLTWQALAWIGGGVAAALVAISMLAASAVNHNNASLAPLATVGGGALARGQPAPDFTATTFEGGQFTLSGQRGRPVLVNFFASWCTQCERELPFMEQSYQRHKADGFVIVGVNSLETGDGVRFYRQMGLTFPAVYDRGDPGRIAVAYNVTSSLPVSVFIDKAGLVDLIQLGALTPDLLEREIQKLSS